MSKIYILLVMFVTSVLAQGSEWIKHDFNLALKEAKQVHKPIFLMYSSKT